jgi:hypothetical protein
VITVLLIVNRLSGLVEFIAMPVQNFITRALPNVHKGSDVAVEYWDGCYEEDLEHYLTDEYEFWIYDTEFENKDAGEDKDWDAKDALAWEFTPVQMFAKGEPIDRDYVSKRSQLIGLGGEFSFDDVAAEFPGRIEKPAPPIESPVRSGLDRVCPWCKVTAVRRYNFFRQDFLELADKPFVGEEMDNPVVWTDGAWTESGFDPDDVEVLYNQYGDCVVCCPACQALFLASALEYPENESGGSGFVDELFVAPGTYPKGHFGATLSEEWILTAQVDQTIDYLEQNVATSGLISWSQWTAAQQIVNFLSHKVRRGGTVPEELGQRGRDLLRIVCERVGQIKEGTLGSMCPHNNVAEESQDENFYIHTLVLEENLPLTNMRRIAGDWEEILFTLGSNFHKIERVEDLENTGWSELDQYIVRRRLLLMDLISKRDTRWAVHAGEDDLPWFE